MAELFVPNPNNYPYIDHIDTDRQNNVPTNLGWVTHKQNMNNPATIERIKDGWRRRKLKEKNHHEPQLIGIFPNSFGHVLGLYD